MTSHTIKMKTLLFLFLLISSTSCAPNTTTEPPKTLKDADEEASTVEDLKDYVLTIPISHFEGDALLLQYPDVLNSRTSYRHLDSDSPVVYETKGSADWTSEVVVLSSYEDGISLPKGDKVKRTYVILRRALLPDPKVYYVAYLYMSDAPEDSFGIHVLGGGKRKVFLEWDYWDRREGDDEGAKSLENAFICGNNILIPCISSETKDLPWPVGKPADFNTSLTFPTGSSKTPEKWVVTEGYDPDEFLDVYSDLDSELEKVEDDKTVRKTVRRQSLMSKLVGDDPLSVGENGFGGGAGAKVMEAVDNAIDGSLGFVKNFRGFAGGLGSIDADLHFVAHEVGIEGIRALKKVLSTEEWQAMEYGVKHSASGGLGGMVTALEREEAPSDIYDVFNNETPKDASSSSQLPSTEQPYVHFGWLETVGEKVATNDVFVGFGACRYHHVEASELNKTSTSDLLLRVFQKALKTQCIQYEVQFLNDILKSGLLKVSPSDHTLLLQEKALHFTREKLSARELTQLLRGLQLAMFSKVYNGELKSPSPKTLAPDGGQLSRSVWTWGQVVLEALTFSQKNVWADLRHGFKLGRNMVRTLKVLYVKLLEDKGLLGLTEKSGAFAKELNGNNRLYVMSLIQFLIRGSSSVYNSGAAPGKTFEDFYVKNKPLLLNRVKRYQAPQE